MERAGPFLLERRLASGGQGEVYVARHERSGGNVAVKRLHGVQSDRHVAAFRREIAVIAALDHPRIVQILDYGDSPQPWFAMELGTGTLKGRIADWPALRGAVGAVLEALGHAHARGVLHLDVKPANVLLGCPEGPDEVPGDAPAGLRLSDFGVALRVRDAPPGKRGSMGTPGYMAPEQIRGDGPALGPETDLYAVGQLVWELCAGRPAFVGEPTEVVKEQLRGVLPTLVPAFPVPPHLGEWLRWLLAVEPRNRPRRAADALLALRSLGEPSEALPEAPPPAPPWAGPDVSTVDLEMLDEASLPPDPSPPVRSFATGEVPPDWRRQEPWTRIRPPPDGGLAMVGVRATRVVGRTAERDRLWAALRAVATERRPRVVVLRGARGVGKSRLAEWLAERADETGAAAVVQVRHAEDPSPDHGLRAAVARWARVGGLTGDRLEARVTDALSALAPPEPWLVRAVVDWMEDRRRPDLATLALALGAAWNRRPLLLVVDDAAHGPETAAFVDTVLRQSRIAPLRALVVLVTGHDGAARPSIEALAAQPGVEALELGPLDGVDLERLLRDWVGLSRELADRVAVAAQGHPGLALRLAVGLRARGALVAGPEGLRVPDQVELALAEPSMLDALSAALDHDEASLRAFEADAVAGDAVRDAPGELVELGLVRADPDGGLVLGSPLLRRALIDRARAAGRGRAWHLRAAELPGQAPERVGAHLLEAGEPERAVGPLLEGCARLLDRRAYVEALETCGRAERALAAAGVPEGDERWAALRERQLEATAYRGLARELRGLAERTVDDARRHGWASAGARALEYRGWCRHVDGHDDDGIADADAAERTWRHLGRAREAARARTAGALYRLARGEAEEALALATEAVRALIGGDVTLRVNARVAAANALQRLGRWRESAEQLQRAREDATEGHDVVGLGRVYRQLAVLWTQQGRFLEAEAVARESYALSRRDGTWMGLAMGANLLGDALRGQGRLEEARAAYLEATDLCDRVGADAETPATNLAITALLRGDDEEALRRAEELLATERGALITTVLALVRAGALLGLGRPEAEGAYAQAARRVAELREVEADVRLLVDLVRGRRERSG